MCFIGGLLHRNDNHGLWGRKMKWGNLWGPEMLLLLHHFFQCAVILEMSFEIRMGFSDPSFFCTKAKGQKDTIYSNEPHSFSYLWYFELGRSFAVKIAVIPDRSKMCKAQMCYVFIFGQCASHLLLLIFLPSENYYQSRDCGGPKKKKKKLSFWQPKLCTQLQCRTQSCWQ